MKKWKIRNKGKKKKKEIGLETSDITPKLGKQFKLDVY